MAYILLKDNIIIQKQPYFERGFIEAPEWVVCGMVEGGGTFVIPEQTDEQLEANRREEILSRLREIDLQSIGGMRKLQLNGTADDQQKLFDLDDEAEQLRQGLSTLTERGEQNGYEFSN